MAVEVKPDVELATAADAAPEAWLFEMSRGEYLRKRIRPDLAESVSDLCDLELFYWACTKSTSNLKSQPS